MPPYPSAPALISDVKSSVSAALAANSGRPPRVIIIGALGRCGTGSIDLCRAAGVAQEDIIGWDMAETAAGGPFPEIAASDVFINYVYLGPNAIPPLVTLDSLAKPGRRLRVIYDVSLDPNNPNNPVPMYSQYTNFNEPTLPVPVDGDGPELTVVSIDHLPTLVAREASDEFSSLLLPSLLTLNKRESEGVWTRAEQKYKDTVKRLPTKEG